jgi:hypothetical protein
MAAVEDHRFGRMDPRGILARPTPTECGGPGFDNGRFCSPPPKENLPAIAFSSYHFSELAWYGRIATAVPRQTHWGKHGDQLCADT